MATKTYEEKLRALGEPALERAALLFTRVTGSELGAAYINAAADHLRMTRDAHGDKGAFLSDPDQADALCFGILCGYRKAIMNATREFELAVDARGVLDVEAVDTIGLLLALGVVQ